MSRSKWYILLTEEILLPICCKCNSKISQELKDEINPIISQFVLEHSSDENPIEIGLNVKTIFSLGTLEIEIKENDNIELLEMPNFKKTNFYVFVKVIIKEPNSIEHEPFIKSFNELIDKIDQSQQSKSIYFN
ncbi:hypothetical protein EHI8A_044510 [Entamoeba histolytica HM-1:IMSS-B]|uniref:Uncharacterized protein n=5 Tax=Entamoeba histolytica TaxID=5759 RepID=B1N2F8_ENTH1|nr:hypothetical protein EHI_152550 [Entamoeba histolytica HM-1:IMSS]EMH77696.1 hypothetical protein EHI8A_044510 [Entamoeba histolytica HM-1:IMSS-B]EMS10823.1 hypothetical protein KM1_002170 [Entamoeba histolytica HM-3:IMSS]ENY61917.1 hypothetical protein EHI7A_018710 [Entamoeba histolytica HM-1:IMSS-A]GAT91508.1 hypothetical protein CL6EHI_152550 [Entamoeba histolytica]EDS89853.1 hypothetical protein EHI_152550 [Entamoeba histolytica HM-1:IMSS]|eukprot:XP_001913356.1 hypothetical protein EHI_152550 [Entamoeba histolytica HM-1:IMSS]